MQSPDGLLETLRDLPGVHGSFLISEHGELLARDMPRYFDDEVLQEVGPRAAHILLSAPGTELGTDSVIRYQGHKLYLRITRHGLLCALLDPGIHMPSLRTAVTLVMRKMVQAPPRPSVLLPPPPAGRKTVPPPVAAIRPAETPPPGPSRSRPPPPPPGRPGTHRDLPWNTDESSAGEAPMLRPR